MADPLFWLALSLLLVAVSLTAVLMAAVPALRELGRASRSAEKLFDMLNRELPPTLEAIRLTGLELTELTDEVSEGVNQAGKVIQQVDQGVSSARHQAQQLQVGTQSLMAGFKAAWRAWQRPPAPKKYSPQGRNLRSRPPVLEPPASPRIAQGNGSSPDLRSRPRSAPSAPKHRLPATDRKPPTEARPTKQNLPQTSIPKDLPEAPNLSQPAESGHEIADVD
ncbi:MAG: hypothetical protein ICV62_03700 [Cyanobacteria bacterium Co-bin13]|nr:hypothetical protein [Cyanobacteria bacterium Co-bin13]